MRHAIPLIVSLAITLPRLAAPGPAGTSAPAPARLLAGAPR